MNAAPDAGLDELPPEERPDPPEEWDHVMLVDRTARDPYEAFAPATPEMLHRSLYKDAHAAREDGRVEEAKILTRAATRASAVASAEDKRDRERRNVEAIATVIHSAQVVVGGILAMLAGSVMASVEFTRETSEGVLITGSPEIFVPAGIFALAVLILSTPTEPVARLIHRRSP